MFLGTYGQRQPAIGFSSMFVFCIGSASQRCVLFVLYSLNGLKYPEHHLWHNRIAISLY